MSDIPPTGYVYSIKNSSFRENIYKIGVTTDIRSRMNSLFSTGVPEPYRIKYLLKFCNNEQNTVETCMHGIFAPHRVNDRREFFNLTPGQLDAMIRLLTTVGVEQVDPGDYSQSRPTSRRINRPNINISQGDKAFFKNLLECFIASDYRIRVRNMSQNQQKAYLRDTTLNKIIVGLGDNLGDFKRAVSQGDAPSITSYCDSLLQDETNAYSKAFIGLIKYNCS